MPDPEPEPKIKPTKPEPAIPEPEPLRLDLAGELRLQGSLALKAGNEKSSLGRRSRWELR